MAERLHRRCPACGAVRGASEFPRVRQRLDTWGAAWQVRCPGCGHIGLAREFAEVEPPAREPSAGRPICRGVRKDGAPCEQVAPLSSGFCRWHDPPARTTGGEG
jgi:hypothetical protein